MAKIPSDEIRARVLLEKDGVLCVDKPAGFESVVKGGGNTAFCFTSIVRRALGLKKLLPAHRLDRDTTGVQIFATDDNTLALLEKLFREKKVKKDYLALCLGVPSQTSGTIKASLSKWSRGREPVKVQQGRGAQEAETRYRMLTSLSAGRTSGSPFPQGASLIKFSPLTGRTHQVRVHAKSIGHPLLGDDNYGSRQANAIVKDKWNLTRHALHAWRVNLSLPGNKTIKVEASLPEDFAQTMTGLFPEYCLPSN